MKFNYDLSAGDKCVQRKVPSQLSTKFQFQLSDVVGHKFYCPSTDCPRSAKTPTYFLGNSHGFNSVHGRMSPCVTFNNNDGSTKSYDYVRDHIEATSILDFVPEEKEIVVNYPDGTDAHVTLHDGSVIHLHKLNPNWNPTDRRVAVDRVQKARDEGCVLTGLLYFQPDTKDLHDTIGTTAKPLNSLTEETLCPGPGTLEKINAGFR